MRKKEGRYWFLPVMFVLFLLETSVFPWILPVEWFEHVRVSPRLVLTAVLYVAMFYGRHYALAAGLAFGFLQDLVFYGHMIGLHTSGAGFAGYMAGLLFSRIRPSLLSIQFAALLSYLFYELYAYGIYRLFDIVSEPFSWVFSHYVLPTVLFNLFFSLLVYVPFRQLADAVSRSHSQKEEPGLTPQRGISAGGTELYSLGDHETCRRSRIMLRLKETKKDWCLY